MAEHAEPIFDVEPWTGLVDGDYDRGVVRLATVTRDRVNYLLFAWIELLPPEMPSPPEDGKFHPCGNDRIYFSRTVLPLSEAIAWYESGWTGSDWRTPKGEVALLIGDAAPEPAMRRFVLRDDVPFAPAWHGMPRVHRLVPMEPPAAPVREIVDGMATQDRYRRARDWLFDRLHFDVLAHDDWLGSVGMIAPNPLLGVHRTRISDRGPGHEVVTISGRPRQGVGLDDVKVVFEERRAAGTGFRAEVFLDRFGAASAEISGGVEELGHQLICARRGILHDEAPGWFFRSMSMQTHAPVKTRVAQPVRRRKGADTTPLTTSVWRPGEEAPPPASPVMRLEQLNRLRLDRFGEYRPLRFRGDADDVRLFKDEREEAVLFIRRLISRARRRVLLVDPYLEAADLLEFAYAAEVEGVNIEGLISPRKRYFTRNAEGAGGDTLPGEALADQIATMRDPGLGFGRIDIRVAAQTGLHDRFLRIDDTLWHCGHSFNGVGTGEVSAMSRVARPAELLATLDTLFETATPFEAWWAKRPAIPAPTLRQRVARLLRRAATTIEGVGKAHTESDPDA